MPHFVTIFAIFAYYFYRRATQDIQDQRFLGFRKVVDRYLGFVFNVLGLRVSINSTVAFEAFLGVVITVLRTIYFSSCLLAWLVML